MFTVFLHVLLIAAVIPWPSVELFAAENTDIEEAVQEQLEYEHVTDEIIVKYEDDASAREKREVRQDAGSTEVIDLTQEDAPEASEMIIIDETKNIEDVLVELNQNPDVVYAEPNYIFDLTLTPNDTNFGNQWALHNTGQTIQGQSGTADADMDLPAAWDITTGSTDVVVAVIDTGININHVDLNDSIWVNPGEIAGNNIDDDGNGYVDDINGWDFKNNNNSLYDGSSYDLHGTHVAGIIGAESNNSQGISGVAHGVKIMVLKALDAPTGGTTADIIEAINYAKSMNVRISNNSYGGYSYSQAMKDAIDASGMLFIAAAGNSTSNNDSAPFYPASYTSGNIISVAATNNRDGLSSFSNYGTESVDIGAPGERIQSTYYSSVYAYLSGTSMAAPQVSGVAALLLARSSNLSTSLLKNLILRNADAVSGMTNKVKTGGRINAETALGEIPNGPPTGLQCEQVAVDSVQCVANRDDSYETFKMYVVETAQYYCTDSRNPSCWISGLTPGTYHIQLRAHDEDTDSGATSDPFTVVVSENWSPSWTVADTQFEMNPGSLTASGSGSWQTRWGIATGYYFLQQNPTSHLSYTITVPQEYTAPYVEIVTRSAMGYDTADYDWLIDGTVVASFTTGRDRDTTWSEGAVQTVFDFQEDRVLTVDLTGIMRLRIPTALLQRGVPTTIAVSSTSNGGDADWFMTFVAPVGVASAEDPVQGVSVSGTSCGTYQSTYGPFPLCWTEAGKPAASEYTVSVTMPDPLPNGRPSVVLWNGQGLHVKNFNIFLNEQFLGEFTSGNGASRIWDFGSSVLWWQLDRYCPCGMDFSGWLTLTADASLWQTGVNTIRFAEANNPPDSRAWNTTYDCDFARELRYPTEGFASFLPDSSGCGTMPSMWGTVPACYEWMIGDVPMHIAFETHPSSARERDFTVFTWLGAYGTAAGTHQLSVNGEPVLVFTNGAANDVTWISSDGLSRLTYTYKGSPNGGSDLDGVFTLEVPSSIAPPGTAAEITITSLTGNSTSAWVAVFGFTETEHWRNTISP